MKRFGILLLVAASGLAATGLYRGCAPRPAPLHAEEELRRSSEEVVRKCGGDPAATPPAVVLNGSFVGASEAPRAGQQATVLTNAHRHPLLLIGPEHSPWRPLYFKEPLRAPLVMERGTLALTPGVRLWCLVCTGTGSNTRVILMGGAAQIDRTLCDQGQLRFVPPPEEPPPPSTEPSPGY